jgi:hypothetical protein
MFWITSLHQGMKIRSYRGDFLVEMRLAGIYGYFRKLLDLIFGVSKQVPKLSMRS